MAYHGQRISMSQEINKTCDTDNNRYSSLQEQMNRAYEPSLNDSQITISSLGHTSALHSQKHNVVHGSQCVLNRSDGSIIAVTPEREHRELPVKPVTGKEIKRLKIFAIVSIFLFPPSGLAAFYFAHKAAKEFDSGLHATDTMSARKTVVYTERLIILSIVCGILMYTLIFTGIGRGVYGRYNDDSRSNQAVR